MGDPGHPEDIMPPLAEGEAEFNPDSVRPFKQPFEIEEHPIDQIPSIRVVVVDAGIAGINAAILLPRKVPGLELVIYERNEDLVRRDWSSMPGIFQLLICTS